MTEMIKNFKILSLYDDVLTNQAITSFEKSSKEYARTLNNILSDSTNLVDVTKSMCKIAWLMIACFSQRDKEQIVNTAEMMRRCKDAQVVALSALITSYDKFLKSINKKDLSSAKRNATRFLYLASVFCWRKSALAFSGEMMRALES